jgi:tRNA G18 (ribose-2'-O)-methylase SpoU
MIQLALILDNLRSAYNVGAIFRTCDAVGVSRVIACGTTPYPKVPNDHRDPVVINRNTREISKTALGAELTVEVEHISSTAEAIAACRAKGCTIYGLEQAPGSLNLFEARPQFPAIIVVGNEPTGVPTDILKLCDEIIEVPQRGAKESLNVSVAAGVALYHFTRNL